MCKNLKRMDAYHLFSLQQKEVSVLGIILTMKGPVGIRQRPPSPHKFCKSTYFPRLGNSNHLFPWNAVSLCLFLFRIPVNTIQADTTSEYIGKKTLTIRTIYIHSSIALHLHRFAFQTECSKSTSQFIYLLWEVAIVHNSCINQVRVYLICRRMSSVPVSSTTCVQLLAS